MMSFEQHNVQFLVQCRGRVSEDMKPYVQYMSHLLGTLSDSMSEDDRFELSYNDYLQVKYGACYCLPFPCYRPAKVTQLQPWCTHVCPSTSCGLCIVHFFPALAAVCCNRGYMQYCVGHRLPFPRSLSQPAGLECSHSEVLTANACRPRCSR